MRAGVSATARVGEAFRSDKEQSRRLCHLSGCDLREKELHKRKMIALESNANRLTERVGDSDSSVADGVSSCQIATRRPHFFPNQRRIVLRWHFRSFLNELQETYFRSNFQVLVLLIIVMRQICHRGGRQANGVTFPSFGR